MKDKKKTRKTLKSLVSIALLIATGLSTLPGPAHAGNFQLKVPKNSGGLKQRTRKVKQPSFDQNLLIVMPNMKADKDDIKDALKEVDGTVVGTMGSGALKCFLVRTARGKLAETEKKLKKDSKNFASIGRNYYLEPHFVPNDRNYPSQWHLPVMNCSRAWDRSMGFQQRIGVMDTGCQANITDLSRKTYAGFDATTQAAVNGVINNNYNQVVNSGGTASTDPHGHGTWVATTAAATTHNSANTAGVAPGAYVYPINIAYSNGKSSDWTMMAGILKAANSGIKILNISFGAPPPYGLTNKSQHSALHAYMKWFHDQAGGVIFMSSGNDGQFDPNPVQPYVNIVTAIANDGYPADFTNYGRSSTFTAPGTGILCSDTDNRVISVNGTSFSCPIVAGVAALVWGANPSLTNTQVEYILKRSCRNVGNSSWNDWYGYGLPDADKAVNLAKGSR